MMFVRQVIRHVVFIREIFLGLLILMVLGGVTVSRVEEIPLGDAIYFAFITGLSVGYGDIAPETAFGRVVSVGIGLTGMVFTGMTVAVATRALAEVAKLRMEHNE